MIWNGILLTTQSPGPYTLPGSAYRGISYGSPWPLSEANVSDYSREDKSLLDAVNRFINSGMLPDASFPPALLTDLNLVDRYVERCQAHGILVRTLLCATPRQQPALERQLLMKLMSGSNILGYDYAYSSCEFSALYSDMHPPASSSLKQLASQLNDFELFNTKEELELYISTRRQLIQEADEVITQQEGYILRITPLEDSGDLVPFEVREIEWEVARKTWR